MKIVIVGAGNMGLYLAQNLLQEEHDITLIERDEKKCQEIKDTLDVMIVCGDGSNPIVLEQLIEDSTELLIAITEDDRVNILSALTAIKYGVNRAMVRINDPDNLVNPLILDSEALHLLNPEMAMAREITRMISTPVAEGVEVFAKGKVELLKLTVTSKAQIKGRALKDIDLPASWIFIGHIGRDGFRIPSGQTILEEGDRVLALGKSQDTQELQKLLGLTQEKVERVVILGGGKIGEYVADHLRQRKISVRMIEADEIKAEELAVKLDKVLIFKGDGTSGELLEEAGVPGVDYFVALTKEDEVNILTALLAKHMGAKKTVVISRKPQYSPVIEQLGIDTVINPRQITVREIFRYVHGRGVSISFLEGGKGEIMEFFVKGTVKFVDKPLSECQLPKNTLIGAIVRGEEVIIPRGNASLKEGDKVVLFIVPQMIKKIQKIFQIE